MAHEAEEGFIRAMHAEARRGNVSAGTDSHLTREFRTQGTRRAGQPFATAVDREIQRLRLEADTLQRMKDAMLGAPAAPTAPPGPPLSIGPEDEGRAGPEAPRD